MHEGNKHWELKVSWIKPFHSFNVIGYKVFRKHIGRVDRGGYCVSENKTNESACLEDWTSACKELETTGELIFETPFKSITEFIDTVEDTGIWRYAVYGIYSMHPSQNENTYLQLTLCSTNTYFIKDTFTLEVVSPHGKVEGSFRNVEGEYLDVQLVSVEKGYIFKGWEIENYTFENPMAEKVKVFMNQNLTLTAKYEPIQYKVNVQGFNGEVSEEENGAHDFGSIVQIQAFPDQHNTFLGWQGENIADIREETTDLLVTGDMDVLGLFRYNKYNVDLLVSGYGSVIGDGKFHYGDIVPIKAVTGYNPTTFEPSIFKYWEASDPNMVKIYNGSNVSTFIQVLGPVTLTAVFEEKKYLITVTGYNGREFGTGSYYLGETLNIKAIPDPGFNFEGWEVLYGNASVADLDLASTTVDVVNEDTKILAKYTAIEFQVSVQANNGTAKLEYFGVEYDQKNFTIGNLVELNAYPDPGHYFSHWEILGDPTEIQGEIVENEDNPGQVYFSVGLGDAKIEAFFVKDIYKVSVGGEHGFQTINDSGPLIEAVLGTEVSIKSVPVSGYNFTGWTLTGPGTITDPTQIETTFIVGDGDAGIIANYELITYTTEISGQNGKQYFKVNGDKVYTVESIPSADFEIFAEPDRGYYFSSWSVLRGFIKDEFSKETIYTFIDADDSIVANYKAIDYSVVLEGDGTQTINFNGTEPITSSFNIGDVLDITAEPEEGFVFSNWVLSGEGVIEDENLSSTTFEVGYGNAVIRAIYLEKHIVTRQDDSQFYSINFTEGTTTYNEDRYYFAGETVNANVDIVSGYEFNGNWTIYHNDDNPGFWEFGDPVILSDLTISSDFKSISFTMPDYSIELSIIERTLGQPILIGEEFDLSVTCSNSAPTSIRITTYDGTTRTITTTGKVRAGEEVYFQLGIFTGYYFTSWLVMTGIELDQDNLPHVANFEMPTSNVTLTGSAIKWDMHGPSSSVKETIIPNSFSSIAHSDMILINDDGVGQGGEAFDLSGSYIGKLGYDEDAEPDETKHLVSFTYPFYMGKYEVTQAQFEEIMGYNPSIHKGANKPVENVTWQEVTEFCNKLTDKERVANSIPYFMGYALPTESEWEYVCRAETRSRFYTNSYDAVNLTERESTALRVVNSGVRSIATGDNHSVFVKTDNTLWGMGDNSAGQLAQAEGTTFITSPMQIISGVQYVFAGEQSTFIIKTDGTLWATGSNKQGKLGVGKKGHGDSSDPSYEPYVFGFEQVIDNGGSPLSNIDKVVTCKDASLFKNSSGGVWAAGTTNKGLIPTGELRRQDWANGKIWWDNNNAGASTSVVNYSGAVKIWYDSSDTAYSGYQRGVQDIAINDSSSHYFQHGLWSSGQNINGQIGNPYMFNPSKVFSVNSYLSYRPIPFSTRRSSKTFVDDDPWSWGGSPEIYSNSSNHVFWLDGKKHLRGAGRNLLASISDPFVFERVFYHPLVDLQTVAETSSSNIITILGATSTSPNIIWSWTNYSVDKYYAPDGVTKLNGDMQEIDLNSIFGVGNNIIDIKSGADFSIFLTSNGELWAQGSNSHGQLGTINDITKYSIGNYNSSSTMPVGSFDANPWGFYDMSGNVAEWTLDYYNSYSSKEAIDPIIKTPNDPNKIKRVTRGGSFKDGDSKLRSSSRDSFSVQDCDKDETVGFRLCLRYWTDQYKLNASWEKDDDKC